MIGGSYASSFHRFAASFCLPPNTPNSKSTTSLRLSSFFPRENLFLLLGVLGETILSGVCRSFDPWATIGRPLGVGLPPPNAPNSRDQLFHPTTRSETPVYRFGPLCGSLWPTPGILFIRLPNWPWAVAR